MLDADKIMEHYDAGYWSLHRVWNVVGKIITEDEYEQITGLAYSNKQAAITEEIPAHTTINL